MTDTIIIGIILLLCIPGIRGIIKVARGRETCDCPGDCSHCEIQCRSNEKYWGKVPPSRYSHYKRDDTQEDA